MHSTIFNNVFSNKDMSYAKLFVAAYNLADHFLVQKKLTSTESSVQYIFCLILCNFFSLLYVLLMNLSKLSLRWFFYLKPHRSENSSLDSDVPLKLLLALKTLLPQHRICNDPPLGGHGYFLEPHL